NTRLVHFEHLGGRKALNVAGAARQALLGDQLGAALGVSSLVLRDVEVFRLEDRVLDVLAEQPRIVAAPGADHHAPAFGMGLVCEARYRNGARALQRIAPRDIPFACHVPSSSQFRCSANTMPASRCQPTSTASPTAGAAASWRFGSCTTTRSAGDRRTCSSSTAPR